MNQEARGRAFSLQGHFVGQLKGLSPVSLREGGVQALQRGVLGGVQSLHLAEGLPEGSGGPGGRCQHRSRVSRCPSWDSQRQRFPKPRWFPRLSHPRPSAPRGPPPSHPHPLVPPAEILLETVHLGEAALPSQAPEKPAWGRVWLWPAWPRPQLVLSPRAPGRACAGRAASGVRGGRPRGTLPVR